MKNRSQFRCIGLLRGRKLVHQYKKSCTCFISNLVQNVRIRSNVPWVTGNSQKLSKNCQIYVVVTVYESKERWRISTQPQKIVPRWAFDSLSLSKVKRWSIKTFLEVTLISLTLRAGTDFLNFWEIGGNFTELVSA